MSLVKLKKRKLKEGRSSDQFTEAYRTSEDKDNLGIIKEHKNLEKKKSKLALKKKGRREKGKVHSSIDDQLSHKDEHPVDGMKREYLDPDNKSLKKKRSKLASKKRREKGNEVHSSNDDQLSPKDEHTVDGMNTGSTPEIDHAKKSTHSKTLSEIGSFIEPKEANSGTKFKTKKVKKDAKRKKKDFHSFKEWKVEETLDEVDTEKVDEISSADEDCSGGMKKWLIKYKESRPGLKILQQRIDEFITAYEEQQEQERKEREAQAAEGGWTVVVHHKGRKKTTDTESGITVGSVAQAAVIDKMGKKKSKEVALDFYRFQKREAQRNEVMMMQSKFEQDKKRIQQLRAARKFRPY